MVGTYNSDDMGGPVDSGRFTGSWVAPDYTDGTVGNTLHADGWDGMVLGGRWELNCPAIADVDLFRVTSTHQYVAGTRIGVRSSVTMTVIFRDFDNGLDYSINNTAIFGNTDMDAIPRSPW